MYNMINAINITVFYVWKLRVILISHDRGKYFFISSVLHLFEMMDSY